MATQTNQSMISFGNKTATVKLNDNNFLLWRLQILAALQGYGLEHHIEENSEIPPQFVQSTEDTTMSSSSRQMQNPEFVLWQRQDKLIISWLFGAMTEEILGEMTECTTAREVWVILENLFVSRNLAKVMELKSKLENLKKGNLTLKDYFAKIKNLIDSLTAAGRKISKEDHILHILGGLGTDFDSTVSVISAKTSPQTLQEVYSLLLAQENRNERNSINPDGSFPSVNVAIQESGKVQNSENQNDGQHSNGNGNRGKGSRSNYRKNWNSNNKPQCQRQNVISDSIKPSLDPMEILYSKEILVFLLK